jgi:hypothetical protein
MPRSRNCVLITDDGVGGARSRDESRFTATIDLVESLGGVLQITATSEEDTLLAARIPLKVQSWREVST